MLSEESTHLSECVVGFSTLPLQPERENYLHKPSWLKRTARGHRSSRRAKAALASEPAFRRIRSRHWRWQPALPGSSRCRQQQPVSSSSCRCQWRWPALLNSSRRWRWRPVSLSLCSRCPWWWPASPSSSRHQGWWPDYLSSGRHQERQLAPPSSGRDWGQRPARPSSGRHWGRGQPIYLFLQSRHWRQQQPGDLTAGIIAARLLTPRFAG